MGHGRARVFRRDVGGAGKFLAGVALLYILIAVPLLLLGLALQNAMKSPE